MSNVPVQLIVAAFQDERGAEQALRQLKQAKKEHLIKIENAAVIRKDAQGKVHIKNPSYRTFFRSQNEKMFDTKKENPCFMSDCVSPVSNTSYAVARSNAACLRQHGTPVHICISFLRSQSAKTKHNKKEKYRCECPHSDTA